MIEKGLAATTLTDVHGDKLSKEELSNQAIEINDERHAIGAGLGHDLLAMPIGKTVHGEVIPMGSGEYQLEIQQELFDTYEIIKLENGDRYVRAGSKTDSRPFKEAISYDNYMLTIAVDKTNFSEDNYQQFWQPFSDDSIGRNALIRKSIINDPEIVFTLITGTTMALGAIVGKKALDKLSDSISSDIDNCYKIIKRAILAFAKLAIQSSKPVTYVFEDSYNNVLLQLITRTKNADKVLASISPENLHIVGEKINELVSQFSVSKIQFLYNEDTGYWEVRYLTTNDGHVIGTKKAYIYTRELASKYPFTQKVNMKLIPRTTDEN